MENELKNLSTDQLFVRLKKDTEGYVVNREFARRVIANETRAVRLFISEMVYGLCKKFYNTEIKYIDKSYVPEEFIGEIYQYLASPYNAEEKKTTWRKLTNYVGQATLYTYVYKIVLNYYKYKAIKNANYRKRFVEKQKNGENKASDWNLIDFEALLKHTYQENDNSEHIEEAICIMKEALNKLEPLDKIVLELTVLEDYTALEVFPKIEHMLNLQRVLKEHQKQNRVSNYKKNALKRLIEEFNKIYSK